MKMAKSREIGDGIVAEERYGLLFYNTIVKSADRKVSPQAVCMTRGAEKGHTFYICQEKQNPKNPDRPYKSYASTESAQAFAATAPRGGGCKKDHCFYEMWKCDEHGSLRGCLVFDVEWVVTPDADTDRNALATLHAIHAMVATTLHEIDPQLAVDPPLVTCDSRAKDGLFKESFHLYYKSVVVENNHDVSLALYDIMSGRIKKLPETDILVWRDADGAVKSKIDFGIATKNRLFRLAFSSKATNTGNSFLRPIACAFFSDPDAPFSRDSVCAPPWLARPDDHEWERQLVLHTATIPPSAAVPAVLTTDQVAAVLRKEPAPEGHGAVAGRRRKLDETFIYTPISRSTALRPRMHDENSNLSEPAAEPAAAAVLGNVSGERTSSFFLDKIAQEIAKVINRFDPSYGASVFIVFPSGGMNFSSTSSYCAYEKRYHKFNHATFSSMVGYPFPRVYYRCLDPICKEVITKDNRIQMPIPDHLWAESDYKARVAEYYDHQRVSFSDIFRLFNQ